MSERFRHFAKLSQIGLAPVDIENRGLVTVGYDQKELLPPYNDRLREARAGKIISYANRSTDRVNFKSFDFLDADWESIFPAKKIIEVVGGYTSLCVSLAVPSITRVGLYALVDSSMTFDDRSYYPNFVLSRNLKKGVLYSPQIQHIKLGRGKFIFYEPRAEGK